MPIIFALLILVINSSIHSADPRVYTCTCELGEIYDNKQKYKQLKFSVEDAGMVKYTPGVDIELGKSGGLIDIDIAKYHLIEFKKTPFIFALLKRTQLLPFGDDVYDEVDNNALLYFAANHNKVFRRFRIGGAENAVEFRKAVALCLDGKFKEDACIIKSENATKYLDKIICTFSKPLDELPVEFKTAAQE